MQRVFEFTFRHPRTSRNVSPPRLCIELCLRLPVIGSPAPILFGCTASFARLGPLQIFPIFSLARILKRRPRATRLRSPASGSVPSARDWFRAAALELVHDSADRFLLRLRLMSCHWLTSRNSTIAGIVRGPPLVPTVCDKRPNFGAPSSRPDHSLRQRNQSFTYRVGDGKVQLDNSCSKGVRNPAGALDRGLRSLSSCSFFWKQCRGVYHG
jgi:hypothetical protein